MAPRTNASTTRARTAAAIAGAILLLAYIAGWFRPATDLVARGLAAVAAPVRAAAVAVGAGASSVFDRRSNDLDALSRTIDDLRIENAKLKNFAAENEALKAALGYKERRRDDAAAARVISESSDDAYRALVIDKGSDDGVKEGQPVITPEGVLIAKIARVSRTRADALLLTDSRSRLAVAVQNAEGTVGVLEGSRGLSMSIALIPQTSVIAPGDTIVTSGIEPGVRRGLPVGVVKAVKKTGQDPFQSADIEAFQSAAHPTYVLVLVSPGADATEMIEVNRP